MLQTVTFTSATPVSTLSWLADVTGLNWSKGNELHAVLSGSPVVSLVLLNAGMCCTYKKVTALSWPVCVLPEFSSAFCFCPSKASCSIHQGCRRHAPIFNSSLILPIKIAALASSEIPQTRPRKYKERIVSLTLLACCYGLCSAFPW